MCSQVSSFYGQQAIQRDAPPNPFLALLNGLAVFGSGVFGALYALAQREKTASNAIIESVSLFTYEKKKCVFKLPMPFTVKVSHKLI